MSECIIPEHEESRKDNLVQHTIHLLETFCTRNAPSHMQIFSVIFVTSYYATNCVIHFRDSDVCDSNADTFVRKPLSPRALCRVPELLYSMPDWVKPMSSAG